MYGLVVIAFSLFFTQLDHIVEYMFFSLLIVWFLAHWKNGTLQWVKTPLDIPILLYVVWVLICVPFAIDQAYSFHEWRKIVAKITLFFFVVHTVKTKQDVHNVLLAAAVGVGTLVLLESAYFFWLGYSVWDMAGKFSCVRQWTNVSVYGVDQLTTCYKNFRAGGFSGDWQWFSSYLVIGFPLLWIGWKMAEDNSNRFRILWAIGLGVSFVGLFLSHTRAAWVAIAVQIFVYVLLKIRNNWWWAFGGASLLFCVLLVLLSLPPVQQKMSTLSAFTETRSLEVRFKTWSLALQDFSDRPLVGIGLGKHSFSKLHPEIALAASERGPDVGISERSTEWDGFHDNIHNTFLARLVQIGLPGFLFFSWIFIVIMNRGATLFQSSDEFASKLALFTGLMVLGLITRNFFDDMFNGLVVYLFWLFVGLCFSMEKILRRQRPIGVT